MRNFLCRRYSPCFDLGPIAAILVNGVAVEIEEGFKSGIGLHELVYHLLIKAQLFFAIFQEAIGIPSPAFSVAEPSQEPACWRTGRLIREQARSPASPFDIPSKPH